MLGPMARRVLVTGGSRGIGLAIVDRLLGRGDVVVASYNRSPGGLEALAQSHPGRLHAIRADLAEPPAADALFSAALVALGGDVDGVVNNAGVMLATPPDADPEHWRDSWMRTLQVNLLSAADLTRCLLLHHAQSATGARRRIVNISSRAAFRGDGRDAMHYAASKGGLVALTKSVARGYAEDGVMAFGVAPGWVKTDMAAEALSEAHRERHLAEIPIGDAAPPKEVAVMVALLLSGEVDHATGATFDLNGASYVR